MKLYLRPKGENGSPLHPTANVEECMKSYDKVIGELYTEEEVKEMLFHRETHYIKTAHHLHINEWFEQFKK